MIRVLFFARLRETLGQGSIECPAEETGGTVGSLLALLRSRGEPWDSALGAENILCAVNQVQASHADAICDGDEVAFFPPVTGG